ncbi:5-formyltetrahydrofolate cyclo-ligase [Fructobacillus ficulneus]|uniref:5-formyltetrahydrofolate cyclo-ligase n=1 Tax=Fructobacillus ficulneus TaxID=157463 RepID=A0A0K8MIL0_9LACO|nr:5-formyltetrahydrofolate cyclo-ligase [Fructobacillus ficulneus]GAP00396.1 5-formyltetrahydrofolate cyclo-ligase [Fructobacillus ficulneus]
MPDKKTIRSQQREKLSALDSKAKKAEEDQLYQLLFALPDWQNAQTVAVTSSLPFEVNTKPIMEAAWQAGKQVVLAKVLNREMGFVTIEPDDDLVSGDSFGILQPQSNDLVAKNEIDLVIVPGLAFSDAGLRVGFGGGYYDRFLKDYQGATVALALQTQRRADWVPAIFDEIVGQVLHVHG